MKRLDSSVKDYIRRHRKRKKAELTHFAQLGSIEEAITWAALGKDERGKRHPHQRRLTEINLHHSRYRLLAVRDKLESCQSFSDLLDLIQSESGRINGLGPLYCYDTALRLGAYIGFAPERVYLHAGTRDGAQALGLEASLESVDVKQLPESLQQLEPYEVEDLLCIYKDLLKGATS